VNERISPPFTSAVERGEGSPDRASGGSIDVLRCTLEPSADLHPSLEKTRMALYRVLPFIPFPTSPGIVPRRPVRHASAHHRPVSRERARRKPHDITPLTPLTLREDHSVVDAGDRRGNAKGAGPLLRPRPFLPAPAIAASGTPPSTPRCC
jgi:hypothetical protein